MFNFEAKISHIPSTTVATQLAPLEGYVIIVAVDQILIKFYLTQSNVISAENQLASISW